MVGGRTLAPGVQADFRREHGQGAADEPHRPVRVVAGATAGDQVFWGDLNQQLRAFDADTGKVLWQTTVPGPIQTSTITYRVNGKQYIAVAAGHALFTFALRQ